MKRFFQSEAGATVLWIISSLVLAAVIAPFLYNGGKNLAAVAATRELPAFLEWLGAACGRSDFSRFFSRSLVIAAILLLPLLFWRVRAAIALAWGKCDSCVHVTWKSALLQAVAGCVIAGGILWLAGMIFAAFGAYVPKNESMAFGKWFEKAMVPALSVPLLEEWLFRGLLLGLWLKFSKPVAACTGTSLFFAFIHFLKLPPGAVISDPTSPMAGFELVGKILLHFGEPLFFIADFATLFFVGMILSYTRLRTKALWFPIGLHAGWIMAFKGFNLLYLSVPGNRLHPWGVGETLRSGIFPMIALGFTAVICHFVLDWFEKSRQPRSAAHHGNHKDLVKS